MKIVIFFVCEVSASKSVEQTNLHHINDGWRDRVATLLTSFNDPQVLD